MAIDNLPITLPQDAIYDITNIVFDIRLVEQITFGEMQQNFVNSTNQTTTNGNGYVNTYKHKLLTKSDRPQPGKGNPFGDFTVTNKQEWLLWDKMERVALSEELLWETERDFTSDSEVTEFQSWNYKLIQDSYDFDLFNTMKSQFGVWGNNSTISGIDLSLDTLQDKVNNIMKLAGFIRNRAIKYSNENTTLTEVSGVLTAIPAKDLVLYIDSALMTYMTLALGNVFNPQYIEKTFGVTELIEIPSNTEQIPTGATSPCMWLCRKGKVSHIVGYKSFAIVDPDCGLKNTFQHRKLGVGRFKTHAGESICLAGSTPTPQKAKIDKKLVS